MPRDLLAEKSVEAMRQLSKEFAAANPPPKKRNANPYGTALVRVEDPFKKMDKKNIKPFSSLLNIDDLDDCDWLEHAAFDPIEAATREKVSDVSFHPSPTMDMTNAWSPYLLFLYLASLGPLRSSPCVVSPYTTTPLMRPSALASHITPSLQKERSSASYLFALT